MFHLLTTGDQTNETAIFMPILLFEIFDNEKTLVKHPISYFLSGKNSKSLNLGDVSVREGI